MRRETYLLTVDRPAGTSIGGFRDYIDEAVETWRKGGDPDGVMFDAEQIVVKVVRQREGKTVMRSRWKDIKTAPKDGTFILLKMESGFVAIAQWCSDGYWRIRVEDGDKKWKPVLWQRVP